MVIEFSERSGGARTIFRWWESILKKKAVPAAVILSKILLKGPLSGIEAMEGAQRL